MRENCVCPITKEVMRDPVVAADTFTYERQAIQRVFRQARENRKVALSPMTREPLPSSLLTVNAAIRSSIGQLPDAELTPAGAGLRDALTDRPVTASTGASLDVLHGAVHAPREGIQPLQAENFLRGQGASRTRPGQDRDPLTEIPTAQGSARRQEPFNHVEYLSRTVDETRAAIEAVLGDSSRIPRSFVEDIENERRSAGQDAALTCGASYLFTRAEKTAGTTLGRTYCMAGTLIRCVTCPIFAGPVLLDGCLCGGFFTASILGSLRCCWGACAPEAEEEELVREYVDSRLAGWSYEISEITFESESVLYRYEPDTRHGAGQNAYIKTLVPGIIDNQEEACEILHSFETWCRKPAISDDSRRRIGAHLANIRRGEQYRTERYRAHPPSSAAHGAHLCVRVP